MSQFRFRHLAGVVLMIASALVACGPAPSAPAGGNSASGGQSQAAPAPARGPRTISLAISREPYGFINSFTPNGTSTAGLPLVQPLAANRLQSFDDKGRNYPELATAIPSTTDGT